MVKGGNFITLCLLIDCNSALGLQCFDQSRRKWFQAIAGSASSMSIVWSPTAQGTSTRVPPAAAAEDILIAEQGRSSVQQGFSQSVMPFQVYQVVSDASEALDPSVQQVDVNSFLQRISPSQGGAVWLGEHHNSAKDHMAQAKLLRTLFLERQQKGTTVGVGLEQVQTQFQPVLDKFVEGKLSLDQLRFLVQWDRRWVWPFENYQEIFETAQELRIPLVALNVNSEDLALVERGGLPALPRETLLQYIADPVGFAQFAALPQFRSYVDYVIRPSYDFHLALGLLKNTMSGEKLDETMSFRNFYSGRILWDETMAAKAFAWTNANPGGLLVGLVGADHVKFSAGIPGRYARMAVTAASGSNSNNVAVASTSSNTATSTAVGAASISVMLNPTIVDSRPSGTVGFPVPESSVDNKTGDITLQLRYLKDGVDDRNLFDLPSSTGGVLPLADYLLFG